jgi:hypothetical protein
MPYTGRPGFSYPFLFGVLGILFSFGRGLAFFAPALWLLLLPRKPAALRLRQLPRGVDGVVSVRHGMLCRRKEGS